MRQKLRISHLLLGAALLASSYASADNNIGVNAAIRNSVQTKTASETALHPAVLRAPVHIGDSVVSGDASALQILLVDQSVFTVGADARMTIDRFVYDPDRGTSDVAASIAKGAFRFMSGHTLHDTGHNAITTPVATIGVRGTIVEGAVGGAALNILASQAGLPSTTSDPGTVTLVALRGPGSGTQGFDKPGAIDVTSDGVTVTLDKPGEAVIVFGPGQPPFGPFELSDAAFDQLNGLLRTVPGPGGDEGPTITTAGGQSGDTLNNGIPGDPFGPQTNTNNLPPAPNNECSDGCGSRGGP